jgi:uncharacterized repeat protein (TIGR01451 family)
MASLFLLAGACFLIIAVLLLTQKLKFTQHSGFNRFLGCTSLTLSLICMGMGQAELSHHIDVVFAAFALLCFVARKHVQRLTPIPTKQRSILLVGTIVLFCSLSFICFSYGLFTPKLMAITLLGLALIGTQIAKIRRVRAWMLTGLFMLSTLTAVNLDLLLSTPAVAATENFASGAYVIDMGQATQTIANGLKPYGLVYDLVVKKGIPVKWAIDPAKARDGVDFIAAGKSYKGGSFIIPAEYATEAATTINTWKIQGVVVDGPLAANFSAPIYNTIDNFPNTVLDAANGSIAQAYFTNAGIPASTTGAFGSFTTYKFLAPSAVSACDDVYVMPHADPTWSGHSNLIPFNQSKGFIWAACHAVSVLERVDDTGDADTLPDMNFLSHVPPAAQDSLSLKLFGSHVAPSAGPYQYNNTTTTVLPYGNGNTNLWSYPIMQFLGKIDLATQNGSEQLYVPENTAQWRDTTAIATFDSVATAADPGLDTNAQDKAAKMVFGPGFGNPNNGIVMYEAGHDHAKATLPDNVTAQRAFLNFILLAGIARGIDAQANVPTQINAGQTVTASATATGGAGSYSYQWYSSCGGSFSNPTGATTSFTAPANSGTCTLRVVVADTCNRKSIGAKPIAILEPQADLAITKTDNQATATIGSPIAYTITVTNNGPSTVNSLSVTDNVPATILNPVFTPSTGAFSYNTTTKVGIWTRLTLGVGQSITLTVQGTVSSTATVGESIVNTATVAPLGGIVDGNASNDSDTDTDSIVSPTIVNPPFNCDGRFYQIRAIANAYSELFQINRRVNPYQQTQIGNLPDIALNGLGFNPVDNYLYALYLGPNASTATGVNASQGLYRIGQTTAENLGGIAGMTIGFQPTAADFDRNGNYYVTEAGGSNKLYKIDVVSRTATLITMSRSTPNLGDMSLNPSDGLLYGVSGNILYIINPTTGTVTTRTMNATGSWGTTFIDAFGNFYAYDNNGPFVTVNLATGEVTSVSSGPTASRSDGAVCAYPPQRLDVVKSAGTVTRVNATTFNIPYTLTIKNTGSAVAPNVQVTENLNLTFNSGSPTLSILGTPAVSGGTLTLNPGFNGTSNINLLSGNDSLGIGEQQTITFTVRVVYASTAAVPTTANNSVYVSAISTSGNPGYTFVGSNKTPVPPPDVLAIDLSTQSTTPPSTANGDTPSPTIITFPTTSSPNVLLSKRISSVISNGVSTVFTTIFNPASIPSDTSAINPKWPTNYLKGGGVGDVTSVPSDPADSVVLHPRDEIEYTIYFLSAGEDPANNVLVCDLIPEHQTFVPAAFNSTPPAPNGLPIADRGVVVNLNSTDRAYTNIEDGDTAQYFPPNSNPTAIYPNVNCGGPNTNGAIVVNLGTIPHATAPGTPANSHGYIRFRAKVN